MEYKTQRGQGAFPKGSPFRSMFMGFFCRYQPRTHQDFFRPAFFLLAPPTH